MRPPCPGADATGCGACWTALPQTTLAVSQASFDFGKHPVGSSAVRTIVITNAGDVSTGTLRGSVGLGPFSFWDGGALSSDAGFPGVGGTCNAALDAGQSCSIAFAFAPAGDPGMTFSGSADLEFVRGFQCDNGGGGGPQPPSIHIQMIGSD